MGGGRTAPLLVSQLVAWEPQVLPCESAPDREPVLLENFPGPSWDQRGKLSHEEWGSRGRMASNTYSASAKERSLSPPLIRSWAPCPTRTAT